MPRLCQVIAGPYVGCCRCLSVDVDQVRQSLIVFWVVDQLPVDPLRCKVLFRLHVCLYMHCMCVWYIYQICVPFTCRGACASTWSALFSKLRFASSDRGNTCYKDREKSLRLKSSHTPVAQLTFCMISNIYHVSLTRVSETWFEVVFPVAYNLLPRFNPA